MTDFYAWYDATVYGPGLEPRLDVRRSNNTLDNAMTLVKMTGPGKYELGKHSNNQVNYRFSPYYYDHLSKEGIVVVTEFDTLNRIFSAKFDATVAYYQDTFRVIGRYQRIGLYTQSAITRGILNFDQDKYSSENIYNASVDTLYIRANASKELPCVDRFGNHGSEQHSLSLVLPKPRVGTFRSWDAQWKWKMDIMWPAFCRDMPGEATAGTSDSLVITDWDPAAQVVSGWFTLGGDQGQFLNLPWRRYP
jgi:hypothetical protein